RRRRRKENAAPVVALWADADGPIPPGAPEPTAIVQTSPGHAHLFWRLRSPVAPREAEELNRRLLAKVGADRSGWDLSQLLRPPGTLNRKYEGTPKVRLLELDQETSYHPRELEMALPRSGVAPVAPTVRTSPKPPPSPTDLSHLSRRARALVRLGNAGAGCPYKSRSEADFAVCLAMFGAGYDEAEIRAVMTDPANGISERTLEKGRHAERYLALTIGKARTIAGVRRSA
ncbi:MAG TPA: DNA-primase RepB domain-containing protein, partial [Rubrobacter sp.]|nr:DNA-primase RepB domain-containing protein [Rubrobacter sp.]